ncbi:MAG: hypothetical protein NTV86_05005 [Planctomycetota bacterium]|nr:hypothetical protein [Planctomycetota bacterium]
MTLGIRKLVVLVLVAAIFLLANLWFVVNWLEEKGVIDCAKQVRKDYLTGTAITIIVALLILLVRPGREAVSRWGLGRRCPVCDARLSGRGSYCSECGSKA